MRRSGTVYINKPENSNEEEVKSVKDRLKDLSKKTSRVIYDVKTIFPFTLFPTHIEINEQSVNIIKEIFFFSKSSFPMLIQDIRNVKVSTNIFFASIEFEIEGFEENPPIVKFLPRNKAIKAKQIIMGLVLCKKENINLSKIKTKELIKLVRDIGKTEKIV